MLSGLSRSQPHLLEAEVPVSQYRKSLQREHAHHIVTTRVSASAQFLSPGVDLYQLSTFLAVPVRCGHNRLLCPRMPWHAR